MNVAADKEEVISVEVKAYLLSANVKLPTLFATLKVGPLTKVAELAGDTPLISDQILPDAS